MTIRNRLQLFTLIYIYIYIYIRYGKKIDYLCLLAEITSIGNCLNGESEPVGGLDGESDNSVQFYDGAS